MTAEAGMFIRAFWTVSGHTAIPAVDVLVFPTGAKEIG
jgi:hypothetical protein